MKEMILISAIILIPAIVLAQSDILQIDLLVFKNNTVVVRDISLISGKPSNLPSVAGVYSLRVLDKQDEIVYQRDFDLNFVIFANQPRFVDSNVVFDKILYSPEMDRVTLLRNGELIFQTSLKTYIKEPSKPFDFTPIYISIIVLFIIFLGFYLYKKHKAG